ITPFHSIWLAAGSIVYTVSVPAGAVFVLSIVFVDRSSVPLLVSPPPQAASASAAKAAGINWSFISRNCFVGYKGKEFSMENNSFALNFYELLSSIQGIARWQRPSSSTTAKVGNDLHHNWPAIL